MLDILVIVPILLLSLVGCESRMCNSAEPAVPAYAEFTDGYLSDITPQGWIKEFLERQCTGLTGHPEAMSYPFNSNLWNGPIKRQTDHGCGWWRYEQTAYYSDGLIRLGYALDRKDFIKKVEDGIKYTIDNAGPNGELGDEEVIREEKRFMWPQAVYFRAMKAMYDKTKDSSIPTALERYYLHYTPEQVGALRNIVNIEGMLWTYGITGNKALLELAEAAYERGVYELDKDLAYEDGCPHIHGVTFCEEMKLPAILYMWTGKEEYRRIAESFEQKLVGYNMLPDGVPSSAEHVLGNSIDNAHETCDIADFTWAEGYFLEMSGDGSYADKIEKAVMNALPGAMTKDFKAIQYFSNMNQFNCTADSDPNPYKYGRTRNAYRSTHETECCAGNVHRVMPNYVSRMWLKSRNGGVVAALYGPSELEIDGFRIEEQTNYPFESDIKFIFHSNDRKKLSFSFRIPGWCKKYELLLNGKPVRKVDIRGGFVSLDHKFSDGDVLDLNLDMPVRVTHPSGQGTSFERGPLLFSYPIPEKWEEDVVVHKSMRGKKSENPDFKCWNISAAGNFNYGNDDQRFTLVHDEKAEGKYPYEYPPYRIRIPVREIDWTLRDGRFTSPIPPYNVKKLSEEEKMIELVPYGCTQLRLTVFPDLGRYKEGLF